MRNSEMPVNPPWAARRSWGEHQTQKRGNPAVRSNAKKIPEVDGRGGEKGFLDKTHEIIRLNPIPLFWLRKC